TTAPGASAPAFALQQIFATGTTPVSVAVADLNGDGVPDVVLADNNLAGTVTVLLNTTVPGATVCTFTSHAEFTVGANPTSVAVGDVNGDGRPDLVVDNNGSANVSVLLNTTAPGAIVSSFAGHVDFATGTNPYAVAIADWNGDGKADLVVAHGGSDSVSELANSTAPGGLEPSFRGTQAPATGIKSYARAGG